MATPYIPESSLNPIDSPESAEGGRAGAAPGGHVRMGPASFQLPGFPARAFETTCLISLDIIIDNASCRQPGVGLCVAGPAGLRVPNTGSSFAAIKCLFQAPLYVSHHRAPHSGGSSGALADDTAAVSAPRRGLKQHCIAGE